MPLKEYCSFGRSFKNFLGFSARFAAFILVLLPTCPEYKLVALSNSIIGICIGRKASRWNLIKMLRIRTSYKKGEKISLTACCFVL